MVIDYQQINNCLEILRYKPQWFFQKDNIIQKLKCLDDFKSTGTKNSLPFLFEFLKNSNSIVRNKTAETIVSLYQQIKSQNELHESLKHIHIEVKDIKYYKTVFATDTYLHLLSISSLNHNGYVRENAIHELAASQDPYAIKFILLRFSDWVDVVRETAQKAIR